MSLHDANIQVEEEPEEQQHLNVSCDECGELPIIGTRYKSRTRPNYDVCQSCWEENHGGRAEGFEILRVYRPTLAAAVRSDTGGRSVAIHSLYDLEDTLRDPSVEDVAFYVGTRLTCPELGATVRRVLRETETLRSVHIHIFGTELSTDTIVALAEGLQENQSARSVSWNLLWNRSGSDSDEPPLDETAATALQNLMEHNTTIQYMFVHRQRGFGMPITTPAPPTGSDPLDRTMNAAAVIIRKDPLADAIFEALARTHLHTIRYSGMAPVQEHNKKKAWAAMIANPHLKRVKTIFEGEDETSSQQYLELLQADKKHRSWLQRWTGLSSMQEHYWRDGNDEQEIRESHKRWRVLKEVLDTKDLDKVPVLYHILRNQPECLLQVRLPLVMEHVAEKTAVLQEDIITTTTTKSNNNEKATTETVMMDLVGADDDTYENLIWV